MDGVAVAALAARPAGDVPGVRSAALAVLAHHAGSAGALAAALVALALLRGGAGPGERAHGVTHALWRGRRSRRRKQVIRFV